MSDPYLGEIRMFAGNFAPVNWAFCDGQLVAIAENNALFNLIGTTYGGDGQTTFALPDLRGRAPVHQGPTFTIGQKAGTETVTLTTNQLPTHTHPALASSTSNGDNISPKNEIWSGSTDGNTPYTAGAANANMKANVIKPTGGSQPHDNIQPYLTINYIICLAGIYPTQS